MSLVHTNFLTIQDVTCKSACRRRHEGGWDGEPVTLETAGKVDNIVLGCDHANGGLDFGCSHCAVHPHSADVIVLATIASLPDSEVLRARAELLIRLKAYVDQLFRKSKGVDLKKLNVIEYSDDPRGAAAVRELDETDALREIFLQLESILTSGKERSILFTQLLHRAEDDIINRLNDLLDIIPGTSPRAIRTKKGPVKSHASVFLKGCPDNEL